MVNLELPDEKMGVSDGKGEMFTVSSGGEILWSRQASFTIECKMNLERLPFDTQPCGLLAGLYSQRAEQVQLVWRNPAEYEALANWGSTCLSGWVATSLVQTNELQSFVTGNFTCTPPPPLRPLPLPRPSGSLPPLTPPPLPPHPQPTLSPTCRTTRAYPTRPRTNGPAQTRTPRLTSRVCRIATCTTSSPR